MITIKVTRKDRNRVEMFRGNEAPAAAIAHLRQAPIGHEAVWLYDGSEEVLLTPPLAISRLVDIYWIQPAG